MANPRIDDLRRRIEREPASRLFSQLAEELRKEGALAEAIRVARAGLAAHPNYPSARLTLGRALFETGQFGPARTELEGVLRGAPQNILAARMLAECLEGLGDPGAALLQYRAAQRLSPDDKQIEAQVRSIEQRLGAAGGSATMAPSPQPSSGPSPLSPERPSSAAGSAPGTGASGSPPLLPQRAAPHPAGGAEAAPPSSAPGPASALVEDFDDVFEPSPAWKRSSGTTARPREENILLLDDEAIPVEAALGADTLAGAPAFVVPSPSPDFEDVAPSVVSPKAEAPAGTESTSTAAFDALLPPLQEAVAVPPEPTLPEAPSSASDKAAVDASGAALSTPTLAELYCDQGFFDKAVEVYEQILEREPHNERARARLIEIKALCRALQTPPGPDPRAADRSALQRKIVRLEQMLAAVRRG